MPRPHLVPTALAAALLLAPGCGGPSSHSDGDASDPALAADPAATQALQEAVSRAINDASIRYKPLSYQYDEDLLTKLDQIEAHLARGEAAPAPRFLAGDPQGTGVDAAEELDHFRESIRRWEATTGKDLRAQIDPLKAEVAARKPDGPKYHPEFHKRFSAAFDDLIQIEVAEMRERRNRALHAAVKAEFDNYRATHPDLVRHFEDQLNAPQFRLPDPAPGSESPAAGDRPPEPGKPHP